MGMPAGRTGSSSPPTTTRMWASAGSAASAFRSSVSRRASARPDDRLGRVFRRCRPPTGPGPCCRPHAAADVSHAYRSRSIRHCSIRISASTPFCSAARCRVGRTHRVLSSASPGYELRGAGAALSLPAPPVPCRRHNKAEHDRVALRARSASVAAQAGLASSCSVIFEILGRIGAAAQASPGSRHRRGARGRTPAARRESDHSAAPAGVSEAASRASASSRPGHGEMAGLPGCGAGQPRPCSVGRGGQWRRSPASGRRASALVRSGPAHMLSPSLAHAPSSGFLWGWPSRRALRGVRSRRRAGAATAAGASPG